MKQIKNVLGFTIANIIIFYIAFINFGNYVVFGTANMNYLSAIVLTALIVALVSASVDPIARHHKIDLSAGKWMFLYFIVNAATIYILARTPLSLITAVGIYAFWVALILGFVVNLAHYAVWKLLTRKK